MTLYFSKSHLSILSVRKALYWLNDECIWSLKESQNDWLIELNCHTDKEQYYSGIINKLINDYALREQINLGTEDLKQAIIHKALKDLSN